MKTRLEPCLLQSCTYLWFLHNPIYLLKEAYHIQFTLFLGNTTYKRNYSETKSDGNSLEQLDLKCDLSDDSRERTLSAKHQLAPHYPCPFCDVVVASLPHIFWHVGDDHKEEFHRFNADKLQTIPYNSLTKLLPMDRYCQKSSLRKSFPCFYCQKLWKTLAMWTNHCKRVHGKFHTGWRPKKSKKR